MSRPTALVVDDEPDICELLAITLNRMDIDSQTVGDLAAARKALLGRKFDICLTDMNLPDGDGLELVEWIQEHAASVPVAVITAHGNVTTAVRALKLGAFDFVSKPVDLDSLRKLVNTALKLKPADLAAEESATRSAAAQLIGHSPAMSAMRDMIARVARSQAPVHICGESGTGKELVARMIHESGPRSSQVFVPVNCGAIPAELMESEFFGHKKGAFTGAVSDKSGLFRSAEGGTLFLDEVADLPLHMQVKLLRAIQEKAVRPVGESREYPVDLRILSATHKDLNEMVAATRFREDLFYRINVIELTVPPLRERRGDIEDLVKHIMRRLGKQLPADKLTLEPQAIERLKDYHFPGNVRELENILERAATLSPNGILRADDLLLREAGGDPLSDTAERDLGEKLSDVERDAIVDALEKTRYNKTAAAKLLGLSFRQLRYRIKKLGID